jgi:hypothetical protein
MVCRTPFYDPPHRKWRRPPRFSITIFLLVRIVWVEGYRKCALAYYGVRRLAAAFQNGQFFVGRLGMLF